MEDDNLSLLAVLLKYLNCASQFIKKKLMNILSVVKIKWISRQTNSQNGEIVADLHFPAVREDL